jgi:hypothetical protein
MNHLTKPALSRNDIRESDFFKQDGKDFLLASFLPLHAIVESWRRAREHCSTPHWVL